MQVLYLRSSAALKSGKISFHAFYEGENYQTVSEKTVEMPSRLLYLAYCTTGMSPGGALAAGQVGEQNGLDGVLPYSVVRSLWEERKIENLPASDRFMVVQHMSAGQAESGGMDCSLLARNGAYYFACLGRVEEILAQCTTQRMGERNKAAFSGDREKILSLALL